MHRQLYIGSEARKMIVKIVQIGTILWCLTLPFECAASRFPAVENRALNYRLPNDTKPETYELFLRTRIDEGEFDYDGFLKIGVLIVNVTQELTIHSKGLRIRSIRLRNINGIGEIALLPYRTNNVTDFLIIPTKSAVLLPGSRYRLDIGFSGDLGMERTGFYRELSIYGIESDSR